MAWNKRLLIPLGLNALLIWVTAAFLLAISNPWIAGIAVALNTCFVLVNTHTAFVIGKTTEREELIKLMAVPHDLD